MDACGIILIYIINEFSIFTTYLSREPERILQGGKYHNGKRARELDWCCHCGRLGTLKIVREQLPHRQSRKLEGSTNVATPSLIHPLLDAVFPSSSMRIPSFLKILPLTWPGRSSRHQQPIPAPDPALTFEHRQAFVAHPRLPSSFAAPGGTQRPPRILFNDVLIPSPPSLTDPRSEDYTAAGFNPACLRTRKQQITRPKSNTEYQIARKARSNEIEWDEVEVVMPDVEHRETLLELAKITGDAYALPGSKSWYDLDGRWNSVGPPLSPVRALNAVVELSIWLGRRRRRPPREHLRRYR